MPLAWIASPATLCALGAAGLGLAVYLCRTLKIEKPEQRSGPPAEGAEIAALRRRLEDMEARWRESEARAAAGAGDASGSPPAVPRPGLNLNRRTQALRLHRRGETAAEIARLLAMPAGEVRLLLKVHHMLLEQVVEGPEGERRLNPRPHSADKASSGVNPSRRAGEPT